LQVKQFLQIQIRFYLILLILQLMSAAQTSEEADGHAMHLACSGKVPGSVR